MQIQELQGFRLSPQQRQLWSLGADSPGYCARCAILLTGRVEERLLARALRNVVERHEILRTAFAGRPGLKFPLQVIGEECTSTWCVLDLSGLAPPQQELQVRELFAAEARRPFDFARAPLLRCSLLRLSTHEQVLLLSLPALCADTRTFGNLLSELARAYGVIAGGGETGEEAVQYLQFSEWRNDLLEGVAEAEAEGREFWRARPPWAPSTVALPFEKPETQPGGYFPCRVFTPLGSPVASAVRVAARSEEVPANLFLLACWQALLWRFTSQSEIVVSHVVEGRDYPELREVLGPLASALPVHVAVQGRLPFRSLLKRVQDDFLAVSRWQEYLRPPADQEVPTRSDRFPFGFEVAAWVPGQQAAGVSLTVLEQVVCCCRMKLKLHLAEGEDGAWRMELQYDPAVFRQEDVQRLGGHFATLLASAAAEAQMPVEDLEILGQGARDLLVAGFNATASSFPRECVHQMFERQVVALPDEDAVVFEDRRLTFAGLNAEANRLAHHLRRLGAGADRVVAIALGRSLEMVVGLLAVLKAGAAYAPLDLAQPRERIALMLEDCRPCILLTRQESLGLLPESGAQVVCLDRDQAAIGRRSAENPAPQAEPENLAYVVFTSGSTGRPKGVAVEHRQLANYIHGICIRLDLPAGARYATLSTFAADLGNTTVFPSLCGGGCLHVLSEERSSDTAALSEYFERHAIDCVKIVPSHLKALWIGTASRGVLPKQCLVLGGEASRSAWLEELKSSASCRILNHYGPSETTVGVLTHEVAEPGGELQPATVPVGRPLPNSRVYLLDHRRQPVPVWVPGELHISGAGLARGYIHRPELTAERFVPDPWSTEPGMRMYRTGDLARHLPANVIEFLGRGDDQVKIRGFRVELGEVEAVLNRDPAVRQGVVLFRAGASGEKRLVAYVVPRQGTLDRDALRSFLKAHLPEYMVPGPLVTLKSLPLLPNGKVDRRSLPDPGQMDSRASYVPPQSEIGRTIAAFWQEVLEAEQVGELDNFFDLGGHSLLLVRVHAKLREAGFELSMTDLFRYPTVRSLAEYLGQAREEPQPASLAAKATREPRRAEARRPGTGIAIIGMAGRFPGAGSIEDLWRNLRNGLETVTFFSDAELAASGVSPELLAEPRYVKAGSSLAGGDLFDAAFFGYSPREAQLLDPQHRIFLETAWEALENAGYDPERLCGRVGAFAGAGVNTYLFNLLSNPELLRIAGPWQIRLGNRSDFLATRVSYKLNLKGPSLNVQTACSTSLVAVSLACESLVNGQCEMALAGGVTVSAQQRLGYLYEEGGIGSPDGHTRAFDARGQGTIGGDGIGVVLLKRLEDALADGDAVRAILKGWAVNNDGSLKVGFTAPSVDGQAQVVAEAQRAAGIEPESIGYVEAHGTGTPLGDPIEIAALTQAFRARTMKKRFCAMGSIKTNVGHLDAAAGIAGLIKTVLSLEHRQIPPSLHFDQPNPEIDFDNSPFYINQTLAEWEANGTPRRAGVSSFGIGGTNCHVVLEEAAPGPTGEARPWELLVLSALTPAALERATTSLAHHLASHPQQSLADVAYTLKAGRKVFPCRRMLVCRDREDAVVVLEAREPERLVTAKQEVSGRPVAFLFPGQGTQHIGMAAGLYREEPTFRKWIDRGVELLAPHLGFDLRQVLVPEEGDAEAARRLEETAVAQPALFVAEYALARLWMEWGVQPEAMLGHSIGEYVAACLAGVFSLEDALALVAVRGRLMQRLPAGSMLSVSLTEAEVRDFVDDRISLAAVNGPSSCVVSGPAAAISALEQRLANRGVEVRRLRASHAFHSSMMEPMLDDFLAEVEKVKLAAPAVPYLSNLTGTWATAAEATDPGYWIRHLRSTVRFADGLRELLIRPERILLEVGPGRVLASLVRQDPEQTLGRPVVSSLRHPRDPRPDMQCLLNALGTLWLSGAEVDWTKAHGPGQRHRVPLPTYPFERRRYWVDHRPLVPAPEMTGQADRRTQLLQPERTVSPGNHLELFSEGAGPRTLLERELAGIWRELLGVDRVGVHDNFFELGGSSVLAVRMGSRLYEKLNIRLSPDFLLEAPTVAGMAGLISKTDPSVALGASSEAGQHTCMVEIQNGNGSGRLPLYLAHTIGGHLYYYRRLARELGDHQQVYGLRALGLEEGEEPLSSIEELASHYLDLVRAHQPAGPYLLGGSSMGGLVAYEMAQQLSAQGQGVGLLAMMDTTHPDQIPRSVIPRDDAALLAQLYGTWLPVSARKLRWLRPAARLAYVAELIKGSSALPEDLMLHETHRHLRVIAGLWQAKLAYRPRPYPGKLLYFRAKERAPRAVPNPELAWIELTELGTETQVVPGDHGTMHDPPHVRILGERLKSALDGIEPLPAERLARTRL